MLLLQLAQMHTIPSMKRIIFVTLLGLFVLSVALQAGPNTKNSGKSAIPKDAKVTEDGWFAPPPKANRPALPEKIDKAFIITIREPITKKTFDAIKRKFRKCRATLRTRSCR